MTKHGLTSARYVRPHEDPEIGDAILFAAPGLGEGASGGALIGGDGKVFGVSRGAVDDDPEQCVAVPVARLRALLIGL